ncbi:hypothetical protein JCM30471_21880 [Desulfuromonas carbonis]|uniref:hypothetical protein n=1 Tax=Desulfuromonas sp. DDH964 TaxID=1823759 RepID=UPI00078B3A5D|nr:hypothetical protein [Desulfuromonas sp. DDH964]AMV73769.1 hypothetical protein DBW_3471 [Desulfuromonas sp. DDH964]
MNRRTEFVEQLSAQITECNWQIDRLQKAAANASPAEESEYSLAATILQQKRERAAEILGSLAVHRNPHWQQLKADAEELWRVLRDLLGALDVGQDQPRS